jgi:perosamine synthetase
MSKLAILGGTAVRISPIPWVNTMGQEETDAVISVMQSGNLSAFYGRAGSQFLGGPRVLEIEAAFSAKFNAKHAVSVNSATTALHTAIAACEIGPGDEVIVTPFTMAATATAIVMNNAVPVFADICPETYCLNPDEIEKWITPRTKGIIVTNLFGLPANLPKIVEIARKHRLRLIEDNAQSPGATVGGKSTGTFADIGVFSLNYHKVIHSGEGGILLTDHDDLAWRCQLIRNHGEMVVEDMQDYETVVLGSNYRMTELHAAIGVEQLKKLDGFLTVRRKLASYISERLSQFSGLKGVVIPRGYEHSFYVYPIQFDQVHWGIHRDTFAKAMREEGFPLGTGYQKPLYLLPMYQHKKVYNQTTFPFTLIADPIQAYEKGICPIVEKLYEETLLVADICRAPFTESDIDDFFSAIEKIWKERDQLSTYEKNYIYST